MALKKDIELPCDVTASHWEITGIVWTESAAQIILSGWVSEKSREAGKAPVEKSAVISLADTEYAAFAKQLGDEFPTKRQLYDFVKTTKEWVGTVEV